MAQKEKKRIYAIWFYLFLGSFLIGVLIMNFGNEQLLGEDGIFSAASINRLKFVEIDEGRFFGYVLKQRMGELGLLLLLSTTALGLISLYAVVSWQGILTGMIITAAVIRYGLKGILLILGSMFPHQCLLIPAGIMLLLWCCENYARIHGSEKTAIAYGRSRKQILLRQGSSLLWILFVNLIGCILESYVNPILLCDLIKIF